MAAPIPKLATFADLAALGDDVRAEIIHGVIVEKAAPTGEHGDTQGALQAFTRRRFHRHPGGRWPGGWWINTEVDVAYGSHDLCRHDASGWRRERCPERPAGRPIRLRPDWVAEILSPSNQKRDLVDKMQILRAAEVPHYWILNPEERVLLVYRLDPGGYLLALTAAAGDTVRAEPFADVELRVGVLFGDDDDE